MPRGFLYVVNMLSGFKSWGELWFSKLLYQAIIKVWSTFSKVVGVGKAHKYFSLTQSNDSQIACCLAA